MTGRGSRESSASGAAAVALASMAGIAAATASFAWARWSNWSIQRTDVEVASQRLPQAFTAPHARGLAASVMERNLSCALQCTEDGGRAFTLLLTHRPELLPVYAGCHIDVAFAGHAHGGQVRVPGVGGLFAPSQGVLPKLTEGVHVLGRTQLVVSRGLGPSVVPMRVNNRPELVVVDLRSASEDSRP